MTCRKNFKSGDSLKLENFSHIVNYSCKKLLDFKAGESLMYNYQKGFRQITFIKVGSVSAEY